MDTSHTITIVSEWNEARLNALAAIHAAVLPYQGWDAASIASLLSGTGVLLLTAMQADTPAGFILWREIAGESEILTVAVNPLSQRRGIGKRLVQKALEHAGNQTCFLEVAANNVAAQNLYLTLGFIETGRRKNYYFQGPYPAVDAILMKRPAVT